MARATLFSKIATAALTAKNAAGSIKKLQVGSVAIDGVLGGTAEYRTKLAEQALGTGAKVNDHSVKLPTVLSFTCCVTDVISVSNITSGVVTDLVTGNFSNIASRFTGVGKKQITVLEALHSIQDNNETITIVEKYKVHKNMQIELLKVLYKPESGSRLDFEVILRESISAEVKYVDIFTNNSQNLIDSISSKTRMGRVLTTEATPDLVKKIKEQSFTASLIDRVF